MAQEGMNLTKNEKKVIRNCLSGKSTFDEERNKIIEDYRKEYGYYYNLYLYKNICKYFTLL